MLPKGRKDGLVVKPLGDEILVYDLRNHETHCLNRSAALVWEHCDGQTTVHNLAKSLQRELDPVYDEQAVWLALRQLSKKGLLEQPATASEAGCSRREVLRRLRAFGKAAALAPVVLSVLAQPAFAQASCATNTDCSFLNTVCAQGVCQNGHCQQVPFPNGTSCGPGGLSCQAGQCV